MRKHWLGITWLTLFVLWGAAVATHTEKTYLFVFMLFCVFFAAWIVRGFFRFIGRAIGHGYRQNAK
jgi:hypothetical protein